MWNSRNMVKSLVHTIILALLPIGSTSRAACLQSSNASQVGIQRSDAKAQLLLADARKVMGIAAVHHRIMHFHAAAAVEQPYQSDRSYPPFFSTMSSQELWFDIDSSVQRISETYVFPGAGAIPEVVADGIHHLAEQFLIGEVIASTGIAGALHNLTAESLN